MADKSSGKLLRIFGDGLSRVYAFGLMLVLFYVGYLAFSYLFYSVWRPAQIPASFLQWQQPTDIETLRKPASLIIPTDQARAPLAHYHRVERPFQPDLINGCTVSGCHEPLPHSDKMKIPAPTNLHVASLQCVSCHSDLKERPAKFAWVNLKNGKEVGTPAVLKLVALLEKKKDQIQNKPADLHREVLSLLKEILSIRPDDQTLRQLTLQIETSEPGSPIWVDSMKRLPAEFAVGARGMLGARLVPEAQISTYLQSNRELKSLAREYLAAAPDSADRKSLNEKIHSNLLKKPQSCEVCHIDSPGLMDFAAAGYSGERSATLKNLEMARIMEQVRHGGKFHLPTLVENENAK